LVLRHGGATTAHRAGDIYRPTLKEEAGGDKRGEDETFSI